jgi:hypothetical protein
MAASKHGCASGTLARRCDRRMARERRLPVAPIMRLRVVVEGSTGPLPQLEAGAPLAAGSTLGHT